MSHVSLIVATSENLVIGNDGGIPWHLPEDLKYFKKVTMGKPIIMGRKTYESVGSKPLKGRLNVVLSRSLPEEVSEFLIITPDKKNILSTLSDHQDVFVIGGAEVYKEFMPIAGTIYLTKVHSTVEGDTKFPHINPKHWTEVDKKVYKAYSTLVLERVTEVETRVTYGME